MNTTKSVTTEERRAIQRGSAEDAVSERVTAAAEDDADDGAVHAARSRAWEVTMGSELTPGNTGAGHRDRKWKLRGECDRVFCRARRKSTTPTPAGAQGVNG